MKYWKMDKVFVATGLVFYAAVAFEQQTTKSAFDPGIRPVTAASIQAGKVAEDAWFAHIQLLAGDELNGRRTGTPDFVHAVEYVESQFKAIGLKPAGTDGYRQSVGFRSATVDAEHSSLKVISSDGKEQEFKIGSEASLSPNKEGAVSVAGSAVFVGYGLVVPGLGLDALKGIDLHGKVAVVLLGSPTSVHGPLKAYFRTPASRWKALKAAGAIGLITIPEGRQVAGGSGRVAGSGGARPVPLQLADPALNALEGATLNATVPGTSAATVFAGSGHSLEELQALSKDGAPLPSFPLDVTIRATTTTNVISTVEAPNGVVEKNRVCGQNCNQQSLTDVGRPTPFNKCSLIPATL